jgi:hypothetical protein
MTPILGRHTRRAEDPRILVHAEWLASERIRGKFLLAYSSNEGQCGHDERGRPRDLIVPGRGRVILEKEERVEVQDDGIIEVEVGVVPELLDV